MSQATREIPFCKQAAPKMCGAAALDMVYRSLGVPSSQHEIWSSVTGGHTCARSYLIAGDCVRRGLSAVVVQSQQPWRHLQTSFTHDLRVILNHRPVVKAITGHYTVLVEVDDQAAVVHDPQFGPHRRESRPALLDLWLPSAPISEITGNVLVAVSPETPTSSACRVCGTEIPAEFECRRCHKPFPLSPVVSLGCLKADCSERLWRRVFCPHCDAGYTDLLPNQNRPRELDELLRQVHVGPAGGKPLPQMLNEYAALVERSLPLATTPEAQQFFTQLVAECRKAAVELPHLALEEAKRTSEAIRTMRKRLKEIPDEVRARFEQHFEAGRRSSQSDIVPVGPLDTDALAESLLQRFAVARQPEATGANGSSDSSSTAE